MLDQLETFLVTQYADFEIDSSKLLIFEDANDLRGAASLQLITSPAMIPSIEIWYPIPIVCFEEKDVNFFISSPIFGIQY